MLTAAISILYTMNTNAQTTTGGLGQHAEQPYLTLNNGVRMPQVGLGLYMIAEGEETYNTEMASIRALDQEKRYFNMSYEDQVKWFKQWNPED